MVGARLCSGFKCEVECAKVASWSRCYALLLSGVCYKKFAVPACNILASFWFKTLVSLIDHSPAKLLQISESQKQLLFELFLCKMLVIEAVKSSNRNFLLH